MLIRVVRVNLLVLLKRLLLKRDLLGHHLCLCMTISRGSSHLLALPIQPDLLEPEGCVDCRAREYVSFLPDSTRPTRTHTGPRIFARKAAICAGFICMAIGTPLTLTPMFC